MLVATRGDLEGELLACVECLPCVMPLAECLSLSMEVKEGAHQVVGMPHSFVKCSCLHCSSLLSQFASHSAQ